MSKEKQDWESNSLSTTDGVIAEFYQMLKF